MNKKAWLLITICLLLNALAAVTIYDIQYTTSAGGGTYPSPYAGQTVTTTGIVTASNYYNGNGFYISMPEGGAWKGILVYNSSNSPSVGYSVQVTGQVYEYNGLTEIRNVSSYQVLSTGNPIPTAVTLTTAQVQSEAYECVLVTVQNSTVTQEVNGSGEWAVNDGTGNLVINDYLFNQSTLGSIVTIGNQLDSITGIVHYSSGIYNLNPRSADDVVLDAQAVTVTLPGINVNITDDFTVAVNVSALNASMGYQNYQFQFGYDYNLINYSGYSTTGTLSSGGNVTITPTQGNLGVSFVTAGILEGQGTLLNLNFHAASAGTSGLTAGSFTFSGTPVTTINQGSVTVSGTYPEVIDTLTVIQRPLINIPAIVIPGETFNIECVSPPSTTGWSAWLYKGNLEFSLPIINSQYAASPPRWILTAEVPDVNVYELYDLRVTADGGINDRTRHSVQVLPTRKTNYYFAQVTDVHMPSHIFSPDPGYDTDSTETVDFREVIKDINIIRPEFLLLTGDLVNEGELEDYNNVREFTKAKRLLGELEVPVYLIAGNHDIGGWDSTPPPAGTARKNWWKNFGWSWLDNTSVSWPYHTQDYSFDYGTTHFAGMEGYNNSGSYDDYLPAIYGTDSYTAGQMQWLQDDLAASTAPVKVLFQHYDFQDQINLTSLGLDMALGGHMHSNSGSITSYPYDLLTDNCSQGTRAYRIIRVNGTTLQPYATSYAGSSGEQVTISFSPGNYGAADSVNAYLVNNQVISFENAVVKFRMPAGNADYNITGGTLEQVDRSGDVNICYVRVNLAASSSAAVTIKAIGNTIPATPANIHVSASGTNKTISWNAVTTDLDGNPLTVDLYIVEASDEPYAGFSQIGTTTNTSYLDTDNSQVRRFYKVKAMTGSR